MKKKSVLLAIVIASMMSITTGCSEESDKPSADEVQGGDVTLYEDSLITGEESEGTTDKSEAPLPRGDWSFDVENGALFVDDEGNIVNREGKPIEAYSDIKRIEGSNGLIDTSVNAILSGCSVDGDRVILDIPPEVEYNENPGSDAAQQAPESYTDVTVEDLEYDPYRYNGMAVQFTGEVWYSDAEGMTVIPIDWESNDSLPSVYVIGHLSPIPQMEDSVFVQGIFVVDEYGNLEVDPYNVEIK